MSSGLPIIASRIGGIPYQVDELNGFVFEAGNETEFCNIVSSVSSDINSSSDLGAVSKNKVLDKFLWSKCADQAILFYEQLIHT
jgi:glycosyltransferase involved in cell wall biosynthesis